MKVVYQKILALAYVDELLEAVKKQFCETFTSRMKNTSLDFDFTKSFTQLMATLEEESLRKKVESKKAKTFSETEKGKKIMQEREQKEGRCLNSLHSSLCQERNQTKIRRKAPKRTIKFKKILIHPVKKAAHNPTHKPLA